MKGYVVQREMFMCQWIPGSDHVAVVVQVLSPGSVIAASREPCNHVAADVRIRLMMMAANTRLLLSPVRC